MHMIQIKVVLYENQDDGVPTRFEKTITIDPHAFQLFLAAAEIGIEGAEDGPGPSDVVDRADMLHKELSAIIPAIQSHEERERLRRISRAASHVT